MSEDMTPEEFERRLGDGVPVTILSPNIELPEVYPGVWRVRETDDHVIDLMLMFTNWRLAGAKKSEYGTGYSYLYCYVGHGEDVHLRAVLAGLIWDIDGGLDPLEWDKDVLTGTWNEDRHPEAIGIRRRPSRTER
jgi:hypothetical protein